MTITIIGLLSFLGFLIFGGLTLYYLFKKTGKVKLFGVLFSVFVIVITTTPACKKVTPPTPQHPTTSQQASKEAKIEVKRITEMETLPYKTIEENNLTLLKGETKIKQEGVTGEKLVIYEEKYKNGKLIAKRKIEEQITKEPRDEIILVGTTIVGVRSLMPEEIQGFRATSPLFTIDKEGTEYYSVDFDPIDANTRKRVLGVVVEIIKFKNPETAKEIAEGSKEPYPLDRKTIKIDGQNVYVGYSESTISRGGFTRDYEDCDFSWFQDLFSFGVATTTQLGAQPDKKLLFDISKQVAEILIRRVKRVLK